MSYPVKGENVIVEFLVDADYYPVLCGTDCNFSRQVEFIPITGPTSSQFREIMPRKEEWVVTVSGVTKIENDSALTLFYMLQNSIRRQRQTIRVVFTDEDGDSKQVTGNVYIGNQDISGSMNDYANCNVEFRGTGAFVIEDVTPPTPSDYEIYSDYWVPSNGNNYINGASSGSYTGTTYTLAATDIILQVRVEGTSFEVVSGTPGSGERKCQFSTSPVRVNFPADLIFDGSQKVFVMFKRPL